MDRKLADYLPPVIRYYDAMRGITEGEQPEFDLAWRNVDEVLDNQFVLSAGRMGLSRWEGVLGIISKGTDSIDARRKRILSRLNEELPYTLTRLREILSAMCGGAKSSAEIEEGTYILNVEVWVTDENFRKDVEAMLDRVCPENLVVKLVYVAETELPDNALSVVPMLGSAYMITELPLLDEE